MDQTQTILQGSSDLEKGAYLGAIASIATADRKASPEELEYISALCDSAGVAGEQKQTIINAANEISGEDVTRCLDVLKNSDLKYSLITDLIAFAKSDNTYAETEQQSIRQMAQYLGVDAKQYSVLDEFVQKAGAGATPEEVTKPGFLSSLGLQDKLQSAGINGNSLLKGLLGIAGPLILAKMVSGGFNRNSGPFGGGGMFGGGGGMFGGSGGGFFGGGGLGSIISMISGGRGIGSTGGLFSRILSGGF